MARRKRRKLTAATYQITKLAGVQVIQCLKCQTCSNHPRDIADRYCGQCKFFHHQQSLFEDPTQMPIRKDLRPLYTSAAYRARRRRIVIERDGNRCKRCQLAQGDVYRNRSDKWVNVVLTMAHLDQDPRNDDDANLETLCAKCHLAHDLATHVANARITRGTRKDAARPLLAPEARL